MNLSVPDTVVSACTRALRFAILDLEKFVEHSGGHNAVEAEIESFKTALALLARAQPALPPHTFEVLEFYVDFTGKPPEPHCSCHLSPPCGDCVDNSQFREMHEFAAAILKQYGPSPT